MRSVTLLFIDLVILLATTLKPGGVKSVIAENLLLKHQLIVLDRARRKAPNLKSSDRFLLGMLTLFMNACRRVSTAVIVKTQISRTLVGSGIAMVCFKRRYLLDYQFAMHRLNAVSR